MELIRFVKWQWKRLSYDDIAIAVVVVSAFLTFFISLFIGIPFLISFINGVGAMVITIVLSIAVAKVMSQWDKYAEFREKEALRIMSALRNR